MRGAESESSEELVSEVMHRAGAGDPYVKDHGNLSFCTVWRNNEGHTEGSGEAVSIISNLWPIQCLVHTVLLVGSLTKQKP